MMHRKIFRLLIFRLYWKNRIFVYITIICKTKTENKRKINKHLAVNKVKKFSGPLPFRPQKNYILNRTPYARTLHAFIKDIYFV